MKRGWGRAPSPGSTRLVGFPSLQFSEEKRGNISTNPLSSFGPTFQIYTRELPHRVAHFHRLVVVIRVPQRIQLAQPRHRDFGLVVQRCEKGTHKAAGIVGRGGHGYGYGAYTPDLRVVAT